METAKRNIFEIYGNGVPSKELFTSGLGQVAKEVERPGSFLAFLSPDVLIPFEDNIFRPYSKEKLRDLADNIAANGVLEPVIVRPYHGKYQILAGHNRTNAARLAVLKEIPCVIRACGDDEALMTVVDSNLNQRDGLLPSEKARAYKAQMEIEKRQGKNIEKYILNPDDSNDNQNNSPRGNQSEGKTNIYRYIRLCSLSDALVEMVDLSILPLKAGVELSYLNGDAQNVIHQYFFVNKRGVLDMKTAKLLRQRAMEVELTCGEVEKLLRKNKKVTKSLFGPQFPKKIERFIPPGTSRKNAEDTVLKALTYYFENHQEG